MCHPLQTTATVPYRLPQTLIVESLYISQAKAVPVEIDPSLRVVECPTASLRATIPAPLSERLDVLVAMAEGAGAATSRGELLAALILAAPESSDDLFELWRRYRRSVARDAVIEGLDPTRLLRYQKHSPGRRPRSKLA